MFLSVLQIISAILTVLVGLYSLLAPKSTVGFTGLSPQGGRGVTEIRAVLGGLFIVLGLAPFFMGAAAYHLLGYSYLGIALVRLVSIFVDKSGVQSNWISLATEIVLGAILVL